MLHDSRFVVYTIGEAIKEGLIDADDYGWHEDWECLCIDTADNSVLYVDNIDAPEDKLLYRDLGVFVDKLNEVTRG